MYNTIIYQFKRKLDFQFENFGKLICNKGSFFQ